MYYVSSRGEWEAYFKLFLTVVRDSCSRSIRTIHRILDLQQSYHAAARERSRSNNINAVVDMLFETPVIQPPDIISKTGITDAAARNLLRQLTEIGILSELRTIYPTVWVAGELLNVSRPE